MTMSLETPGIKSRQYRIITVTLGLIFVIVSIAILVVTDRTIGPIVVSLVVGLLGVDAIISASRNKPSLLSRIGALP